MPMDWRQLLAMTMIGAGGGNPALAMQMQQQKKDRESLSKALMPQTFPDMTGHGSPSAAVPAQNPGAIAAALAKIDPVAAAQWLQNTQMTPYQQASLAQNQAQFDARELADLDRDVASTTERSIDRAQRASDRISDRAYDWEKAELDRKSAEERTRISNPTGTGPFAGNSIDAQTMNMLVRGVKDPAFTATPEYSAAYTKAAEPKMQFDPNSGSLIPINPDLSWAPKPVGNAAPSPPPAPAAPPVPQSGGRVPFANAPAYTPPTAPANAPAPIAAAPGQPTIGRPVQVTPGRYENTTEFQRKAQQNYAMTSQAAPTIDKYESALTGFSGAANAAGSALTGGVMASDPYKLGQQAGTQFVQSYLYTVTGQAAPNQEVDKWYKILMPQIGDTEAVLKQKRSARARALEAMKQSATTGKPAGLMADADGGGASASSGRVVDFNDLPGG